MPNPFPFALPTPPPDVQERQVKDRDRLVRSALFAADEHLIGSSPAARAEATRIAVTAAIGYLIGHGLITMLPADQWPEYLNMRIPAHLES